MAQQQSQDATATAASASLIALFASVPVALFAAFVPLIRRLGPVLALLPQLRAASGPVIRELRAETPALVNETVTAGVDAGVQAADAAGGSGVPPKLPGLEVTGPGGFESHAERAARAIREDLEGKLNGLQFRIARFANDVYQAVVADASLDQIMGRTPAEAQHAAYDRLVKAGITGFTDSKGRNWELTAYVEMAVRTAVERAYNVAQLDRLRAVGFTYFVVSDDGHPCPLCQPWQGVVLTDSVPDEYAHHTIAEATSAGLFHPRCRHVLDGWQPGTPVTPPHEWGPEDQQRYDESQQHRALERRIRAAKREVAAAFTPQMETAAKQRLRAAQANMRDFINQTGRIRRSNREQLHL